MVRKSYKKTLKYIEKNRFKLLLLATFLAITLPAFGGKGLINNLLFAFSMSFLFIQSMVVASSKEKKNMPLRYLITIIMIIIFMLKPFGLNLKELDIIKLALLVLFFINITYYLIRFLIKAGRVNSDVIITSINIYLLMGIVAGNLAYLFYFLLPGSYNIPSTISDPNFVTFIYYSFITMSTVGYGDITPILPESQTLGYLMAVTGQLYVAIIIAFLVGKLLVAEQDKK